MFSFGIRTRQNAAGSPRATSSPRSTGSPGSVGTPTRNGASPRAEVGEIDTRAPFQSVKAAVSMFGEASPRSKPAVVKKTKTAEERVLEKETHLHLTLKELEKFKQQLKSAESTKAQALRDLEKANRTLQELTGKLETASESKQVAIAATEAAKKRTKQLEEAKSSQSREEGGAWKQDVDSEREQYKASAAELISVKQELTNIRQDFDAALEAKLTAFQKAADAQHAAKVNRERLAELSSEVAKMRETLGQVKIASLQSQEEQNKILAEKEAQLEYHRKSKEEIEKKIQSLKNETNHEVSKTLEEKLEEATETIGVLQEQLKNVKTSDLEAIGAATLELEEAKKALQVILEEERSHRSSVDPLEQELEDVKRDCLELKKKEAATELVSENLRVELEKSKAELEAAIAAESEAREASDNMLIKLQQLLSETEIAVKEEKEMRTQTEQLKQEAETARVLTKEIEEKLVVAMKEAEEAKAAEKLVDDKIYSSSADSDSGNTEFSNKIKLSTEDFESLSRKVEEVQNSAEKKVEDAVAQVEAINESEKEAALKLKAGLMEIEDLKTATEEALKRAEMAEAAKQMVEGELRKWRQEENKQTDGEVSDLPEESLI